MSKLNEMTDEEKSVMLAKLVGWKITIGRALTWVDDDKVQLFSVVNDSYYDEGRPNLYHESKMAVAWRVLNWAADNQMILDFCSEEYFMESPEDYWQWTPENAQRNWLDKILELAIEAGLV